MIQQQMRMSRAGRTGPAAYVAKEQWDLAAADFAEVRRINPDDLKAYYNRGLMGLGRGQLHQAMADFRDRQRRFGGFGDGRTIPAPLAIVGFPISAVCWLIAGTR
jgi:hypothetical protein